jgi:glycosyltransferase involved in cell wall biosynthesis
MKIVHLSTGHLGGAGLAARRLSAGLQAVGVDSTFAALSHPTFLPNENEMQIFRSFPQRASSALSTLASKQWTGKSLVTPTSANIIVSDFLDALSNGDNTVFHIHNWFNIFSQSNLAELSHSYKFVLTLHDQRSFTGACHYSLECRKFQENCAKCPQLPNFINNYPSRIYSGAADFSQIFFVSPSLWLFNLAKSSKMLKNSIGRVIPNSFFGYEYSVTERRRIDSAINVGFAAMDSKAWIKGGDIVSTLRQNDANEKHFRFLNLSDFDNQKDFWQSIDVLLVPSRADNSPNVIHEAKLWGVPVISSSVGGIPEILNDKFDGIIDPWNVNTSAIKTEIRRVFDVSKNLNLRSEVSERHRIILDSSLHSHVQFYEELLENKTFTGEKK